MKNVFSRVLVYFFLTQIFCLSFVYGATLKQLISKDEVERQFALGTIPEMENAKKNRLFEELLVEVKKDDWENRWRIVEAIGTVGGEKALNVLIDLMKDSDRDVRKKAIEALAMMKDSRAISAITSAIEDKDPKVRESVVWVLGFENNEEFIPVLIQGLKDSDKNVRLQSKNSLIKAGGLAVREIIKTLTYDNLFTRWEAEDALIKIKEPALKLVTEATKSDNPYISYRAMKILREIGSPEDVSKILKEAGITEEGLRIKAKDYFGLTADASTISMLLNSLNNKEMRKVNVIEALGIVGSKDDKSIISKIVPFLFDDNYAIRRETSFALERLGWQPVSMKEKLYYYDAKSAWDNIVKLGEPAVELLLKMLKDSNPTVRSIAAETIGELRSRRAVKSINRAMNDENKQVRLKAIHAAAKVGDLDSVLPMLKLLKDKDSDIKTEAIRGLGVIKDIRAIEPLVEVFRNEKTDLCNEAADSLVNLGQIVIEPIKPKLTDSNKNVKTYVASVIDAVLSGKQISRIQPEKTSFEKYVEQLKDSVLDARIEAANWFGKFGDRRATQYLVEAMRNSESNEDFKMAAISAIGMLKDTAAIPGLIENLYVKDSRVRNASAKVLTSMGKQVVEPLIPKLDDPDKDVSYMAKRILEDVGAAGVTKTIAIRDEIEKLIKELKNPKVSDRIKAAEALGEKKNPRAVEPLIASLSQQDANKDLKKSVVTALSKIGDFAAAVTLSNYISDEDNSIKQASTSFFVSGGLKSLPILDKKLTESDPKIKKEIVDIVGKINDKSSVSILVNVLKDQSVDVVVKSVRILRSFKDEKAIEPLISLLSNPNETIRNEAAGALIDLGGPVVEPLKPVIMGKDETAKSLAEKIVIKIQGEDYLKKIKGIRDFDVLVKELPSTDPKVRAAACNDLGALNDKRAVPYLINSLSDNDSGVKIAATNALKVYKDLSSIKPLIGFLQNSDETLKNAAVNSLVNIGAPVVDPLKPLLTDKNENVKKVAEEIIIKVGGEDLLKSAKGIRDFDVLVKEMNSSDVKIKVKAIKDIAKLNDKRVVPHLLTALSDADDGVKSAAISGLGLYKDDSSITALIAVLSLQNSSIKEEASTVLISIGTPVLSAIKPKLTDKDDALRTQAEKIVIKIAGEETLKTMKGIKDFNMLVKELKSSDPAVRSNAATELGKLGNKNAAQYLIDALNDPDEQFKLSVIKAMGLLKDEKAVVPLIAIFSSSSPKLQAASVDAVVSIGKPSANLLSQKINDKNIQVATNAKTALQKLGLLEQVLRAADTRTELERLIDELKDSNTEVRVKACTSLAKLKNEKSIVPLMECFAEKDSAEQVKMAVVDTLGIFDDEKVITFFVDNLSNPQPAVSSKISALIVSKGDTYINSLKKIFKSKPDLKKKIISLYEKMATKASGEALIAAMGDKDNDVAIAAIKVLGKIKNDESVEALITNFYLSDEKIREESIGAVAAIGDLAVKQLVPVLDEKNVNAEQSALKALERIGSKDALEAIAMKKDKKEFESFLNDLKNDNPEIRWRAAEALGKFKNIKAVDPLIKSLKDSSEMVQTKAIDSLGNIGDERAVMPIIKFLETDSARIKEIAIKTLVKIGAPAVAGLKEKENDKKIGDTVKMILKKITGK